MVLSTSSWLLFVVFLLVLVGLPDSALLLFWLYFFHFVVLLVLSLCFSSLCFSVRNYVNGGLHLNYETNAARSTASPKYGTGDIAVSFQALFLCFVSLVLDLCFVSLPFFILVSGMLFASFRFLFLFRSEPRVLATLQWTHRSMHSLALLRFEPVVCYSHSPNIRKLCANCSFPAL